jgi:serine/threonine-protein phosphatase Stp1
MQFETVARTHVGCRRKINEDAVLARPDLRLWAVADGMGGHQAGEVASALVVESLGAAQFQGTLQQRASAVRLGLQQVNARLIELSAGDVRRTIGSTVATLLVEGAEFTCLWAGDSRVYRLRAGQLAQITRDHSLVQDLVDLGEIAPDEARGHPNGNVITRAVGVDAALDLEEASGEAQAGDLFLLASDGLMRVVPDDEIERELSGQALEVVADRLLDLCLERGAPDNVSFVLVRISPN